MYVSATETSGREFACLLVQLGFDFIRLSVGPVPRGSSFGAGGG